MDMARLDAEIAHSKDKILKEQARLRRLERKKMEAENAAIVADVRSGPFSMEEFQAFMARKNEKQETEDFHED
ncbi:MAG: DUF4315 family protein [Ethanoligenens sp.]